MVWARSCEAEDFGSSASLLISLRRARKVCPLLPKGIDSVSNYHGCQEFPQAPLIFIAHCFGGLVILKVSTKGSPYTIWLTRKGAS